MTRQEILTKMQNLQILETTGSKHELWVEAFKQYNSIRSPKVKMGCGSCYEMVREWLKNG